MHQLSKEFAFVIDKLNAYVIGCFDVHHIHSDIAENLNDLST